MLLNGKLTENLFWSACFLCDLGNHDIIWGKKNVSSLGWRRIGFSYFVCQMESPLQFDWFCVQSWPLCMHQIRSLHEVKSGQMPQISVIDGFLCSMVSVKWIGALWECKAAGGARGENRNYRAQWMWQKHSAANNNGSRGAHIRGSFTWRVSCDSQLLWAEPGLYHPQAGCIEELTSLVWYVSLQDFLQVDQDCWFVNFFSHSGSSFQAMYWHLLLLLKTCNKMTVWNLLSAFDISTCQFHDLGLDSTADALC